MNISFSNDELKDLHLCLNAPKLDAKGASVQLLEAYFLANLSADLVDTDFVARGKVGRCTCKLASHPVPVQGNAVII